mmetsp:Transcript_4367/g.7378  ORF Transcript_4367/g.7378 Transcript_4367/m.7378 type:complete len:80 (+) Transcript_4367:100-339(+)
MAMINQQLESMITKLKGKLQQEVQQRIENQKTLSVHIQQIGTQVETELVDQFQIELKETNEQLDKFEEDLYSWQPHVLQ